MINYMLFNCAKCNYDTNNKHSYNLHLKTKKHNQEQKNNKTDDLEYMKKYMNNYYKSKNNLIKCECGRDIKEYTKYTHIKTDIHKKLLL